MTRWTAACQASLSITNSRNLLKLMSIESVMPSNHLILCCPLLLPSVFPSIRVFSDESVLCIRWPKYWSFSFSISACNDCSGLISFRMNWFDLLAAEGDTDIWSLTLCCWWRHSSCPSFSLLTHLFWKGVWQPPPVFLPGKPHGQRSLVGCSPGGHKRVRQDLATKQQQIPSPRG